MMLLMDYGFMLFIIRVLTDVSDKFLVSVKET
jgi:hypothetical protein